MDVFVHIPKSAGSTIRAVLSRQYGVEHILYFEPESRSWERGIDPANFLCDQICRNDVRLITGHYRYGVHNLIKRRCRYFALMRNPIDRALSEYYYAYCYPDHRLRRNIISGQLSIEEFMVNDCYTRGDEQAMMLAGDVESVGGSAYSAIENAQLGFVLVGTTERFLESILLTAKELRWNPPLFINKNVTKLDDDIQARRLRFAAEAHIQYRERFSVDYEVYKAVDALLTRRIEDEGSRFQCALHALGEIQHWIAARSGERVFELYELDKNDPLPDFALDFMRSEPYRIIEDYLSEPMAPTKLPNS